MNVFDIVAANKKCTGCGSCQSICKKGAIRIQMNSVGFYECVVEKEKCIDCGLCLKVCPAKTDMSDYKLRDAEMYAVQANAQEVVQNSSSGGVAHVLSELAIDMGYSVVGVAYDYEANKAVHRIANDSTQIKAFDGSKYLQSYTADAFSKIVVEAKKNRESNYLVVGTPCQIAGLANLTDILGIRSQFVLIEFFCHGVPTYYLWEEELRQLSSKTNGEQIQAIRFRSKKYGWHTFCMECRTANHTVFRRRETDFFWNVYFENMMLNRCCYLCSYKGEQTSADIRIGDYWGQKFENRSDGVSLVFACSTVGKSWLDKCCSERKLKILERSSYEDALLPQSMESKHTSLHTQVQDKLEAHLPIKKVVSSYRKQQSFKEKLKRCILKTSILIPAKVKSALRSVYRKCIFYK